MSPRKRSVGRRFSVPAHGVVAVRAQERADVRGGARSHQLDREERPQARCVNSARLRPAARLHRPLVISAAQAGGGAPALPHRVGPTSPRRAARGAPRARGAESRRWRVRAREIT
jgi:hypothetical protein